MAITPEELREAHIKAGEKAGMTRQHSEHIADVIEGRCTECGARPITHRVTCSKHEWPTQGRGPGVSPGFRRGG